MEKFMFRKDNNVDWTSIQNEQFPFSTASHSYDVEWQKEKAEFFATIKSGKLPPLNFNSTKGIDYINKGATGFKF